MNSSANIRLAPFIEAFTGSPVKAANAPGAAIDANRINHPSMCSCPLTAFVHYPWAISRMASPPIAKIKLDFQGLTNQLFVGML